MSEINLCNQRKKLLSTPGHLIVKGGPGSGKTTISLLKAAKIINEGMLLNGQKILFLSFARATVSRVLEHSKALLTSDKLKFLEINTYHGFCWSIIKSYGNLIIKPKPIRLLTPPEASSILFQTEAENRKAKIEQLLEKEGVLSFDLFANLAGRILSGSKRLREIYSDVYPYIFVDEFQDTNPEEWEIIKLLGINSNIIALADLEQRIYDFRGSDPNRINEFEEQFKPKEFDFHNENNRSSNTDIVMYGDHLLTGENKGRAYNHVKVIKYPYNNEIKAQLKYTLLESIKRLRKEKTNEPWSICILVRSKKTMLSVSSYLSQSSKNLPSISHEVLIDPAGPSLSAAIIANLLEPIHEETNLEIIKNIILHIRGRKETPSQTDIEWSGKLTEYLSTGIMKGKKKQLFLTELNDIVRKRQDIILTGVPENDWLKVRKLFSDVTHPTFKNIFEDSQYLRLLNKGAILSSRLSESWRMSQNYNGAKNSIKEALQQEHFSMSQRKWSGVLVMTLHKSKGKEFDEVIIWDEQYSPIVRPNAYIKEIEQSKYLLRVGVTRARKFTSILTPQASPCILV
jgi:DNA helicase-2/ATP-dependent DNA helicase PcrA